MRFALTHTGIHPAERPALIIMSAFLRCLCRLYHVHVLWELEFVSLPAVFECLIRKSLMHINGILESMAVEGYWVILVSGWIYRETPLIGLVVEIQRDWCPMHVGHIWLPPKLSVNN